MFTDSTVPRPTDLYGVTKAATESYLLALGAATGVQVNVIRPGYTFGEPAIEGGRVYTDTKLPDLVRAVRSGGPVEVTKDAGTQFIWAQDSRGSFEPCWLRRTLAGSTRRSAPTSPVGRT